MAVAARGVTEIEAKSEAIAGCEERVRRRTPLTEVGPEFSFGLAVDQDRNMMPRQQLGLGSRVLDHIVLSRQEVGIAHFHAMLDCMIARHRSAALR